MPSCRGHRWSSAIAALVLFGTLVPAAVLADVETRESGVSQDDQRRAVAIRDVLRGREARVSVERRELRHDRTRWREGRAARGLEHRRQIAATWGVCVTTPPFRKELDVHAQRIARLHRIIDVSEDAGDSATAARARALLDHETDRHVRTMEDLRRQAGFP